MDDLAQSLAEADPTTYEKGPEEGSGATRKARSRLPEMGPTEEEYKALKKRMKELLVENDELTGKILQARSAAVEIKHENNHLLDRLSSYEDFRDSDSESSIQGSSPGVEELEGDDELEVEPVMLPSAKPTKRPLTTNALWAHPTLMTEEVPHGHSLLYAQKVIETPSTPVSTGRKRKTVRMNVTSTPPTADTSTLPVDANDGIKAKKPRATPVSGSGRNLKFTQFDDHGSIVFPFQSGAVTIERLGTIVYDRESFHNDRYIFPVGYMSSRKYASMTDPDKQTVYTSSVLDGGEGPTFQVVSQDAPDRVFTGNSATGVWTLVMKAVNVARNKEHTGSLSELPNAYLCKHYTMHDYSQGLFKHPRPRKSKAKLKQENDGDGGILQVDDVGESRAGRLSEPDTAQTPSGQRTTAAGRGGKPRTRNSGSSSRLSYDQQYAGGASFPGPLSPPNTTYQRVPPEQSVSPREIEWQQRQQNTGNNPVIYYHPLPPPSGSDHSLEVAGNAYMATRSSISPGQTEYNWEWTDVTAISPFAGTQVCQEYAHQQPPLTVLQPVIQPEYTPLQQTLSSFSPTVPYPGESAPVYVSPFYVPRIQSHRQSPNLPQNLQQDVPNLSPRPYQ
ncbi:hypothetical protein SeMB42_g05160 [Synchytrium endobioticum]|uniref:INO80 complex subunit E N-terminal domain-containing protein n=1 Tax=Synchytrium endobioticum TaxID=286115 RepID=A0A507CTC4_9FUNG|nr:hypothetical protein SeMB42_g05160 [Synchytrium endobioticum]